MRFQIIVLALIILITGANVFMTSKASRQRAEFLAIQRETEQMVEEWEEQDQARYGIMPNLNPLSLKRGGYPDVSTTTTVETDSVTADKVNPIFREGFEAGVKWGILSYMKNPDQDSFDFHIRDAQRWYFWVVVDRGKTILDSIKENKE